MKQNKVRQKQPNEIKWLSESNEFEFQNKGYQLRSRDMNWDELRSSV